MARTNLLQLLGNVHDPTPAAGAAPEEPLGPPSVTPDPEFVKPNEASVSLRS